MKTKNHRPFAGILSALAFLAAFIVPGYPAALLGMAYDRVNATTKTNLTDQTAKVQEELWSRRVVLGADLQYQDNPFSGDFAGEPGSGKAVIRIVDTEKVSGTIVNIPTMGGLGGPGAFGASDRIGKEQKFQVGNFQIKIGRFWFGVGFQNVARDETVIGSRIDKIISDGLRTLHAKKRNDDIIMSLLQIPGTTYGGRNLIRPDNVTADSDLVSANTIDVGVLSKAKNALSGLGALPMSMGPADSGGSQGEGFVYFGTHHALASLDTDPTYLDGITRAMPRGKDNPLFKGNYVEWNQLMIYRWFMRDHGNWGPVGSPLCPRAWLGTGVTAVSGSTITGGGNAAGAAVTPAPAYFEFFASAPYTYHNGDTIAAVTNVNRYILIINQDGTGYGLYTYQVNDGNTLTLSSNRIAISGGGTQTNVHPSGSLIVQCEATGVTTGTSLIFGREMMATGVGSIDGKKVNAKMGERTQEIRNHGVDIGIGAEAVWGCSPVKRADNVYPNVMVVRHAVSVSGAPNIS